MKQKKFTIEEHRETGAELKKLGPFSVSLSVKLSNTYGATSRVGKLSERLHALVSQLRSELENQYFRDHPKRADIHTYYGCKEGAE